MSDELISGLDQTISFDLAPVIKQIDQEFESILATKDVHAALDKITEYVGMVRISGVALTKWLYRLHQHWQDFGISDNFYDTVSERIGYTKVTLDRYIAIWDMYENKTIPPALEDKIMSKPLRQQVPIAIAVAQGYEMQEDTWGEIADSPDSVSLGKKLREIKGQNPRSSGLFISLKRNGDIYATNNKEQFYVGHLEVNSSNETVIKAVERISSNFLKE